LDAAVGVQVVDAEAIAPTATDATTQLTRIKGANPQAVLVWTTLPSATVVAKAYRELALPYQLYYSESSANPIFLTQAGDAANGVLFVTEKAAVADAIGNDDPQKRALPHYATAFAQQYPKDGPPSIFGGFGYDAVYVLAQGLQRGGASSAALRDALEHVTYTGVSGVFRISTSDHNGLGSDAVELVQAQNGNSSLSAGHRISAGRTASPLGHAPSALGFLFAASSAARLLQATFSARLALIASTMLVADWVRGPQSRCRTRD